MPQNHMVYHNITAIDLKSQAMVFLIFNHTCQHISKLHVSIYIHTYIYIVIYKCMCLQGTIGFGFG